MIVLKGWPLDITVDDIFRGQGMDPLVVHAKKPSLEKAAGRALADGMSLLHPAAVTREVGVKELRHERLILENDAYLTGPLVTRHLANAHRLVFVVCTIGPELESAVSAALTGDPFLALALDGLGNAAVERLSQQICAHIGEQIQPENMTASTPLSPGNPDWPVEVGQAEIFGLLDSAKIGISLTTASMMFPKKSMSFVVGIGPDMSQTGLCTICSLKETCRYNHA